MPHKAPPHTHPNVHTLLPHCLQRGLRAPGAVAGGAATCQWLLPGLQGPPDELSGGRLPLMRGQQVLRLPGGGTGRHGSGSAGSQGC